MIQLTTSLCMWLSGRAAEFGIQWSEVVIPHGTQNFFSAPDIKVFSLHRYFRVCCSTSLATSIFFSQIGTAKEPPSSPPCSPEVEDLFSQGFILKPADRKTARQLLRHPAIMAGKVAMIVSTGMILM